MGTSVDSYNISVSWGWTIESTHMVVECVFGQERLYFLCFDNRLFRLAALQVVLCVVVFASLHMSVNTYLAKLLPKRGADGNLANKLIPLFNIQSMMMGYMLNSIYLTFNGQPKVFNWMKDQLTLHNVLSRSIRMLLKILQTPMITILIKKCMRQTTYKGQGKKLKRP